MQVPQRKATSQKWKVQHSKCNLPLRKCSRHHSKCSKLWKRLVYLINRHNSLLRKCKIPFPLLNSQRNQQTQMVSKVLMVSRVLSRVLSKVLMESRVLSKVLLKILKMFHRKQSLLQTQQSNVLQHVLRLAETPQMQSLPKSKLTKVQVILNRVQSNLKKVSKTEMSPNSSLVQIV